LEGSGSVECFAGVGEEDWIFYGFACWIFTRDDISVGIVDYVRLGDDSGRGGLDDVADCAEVVGEGPKDIGGGGVGEEFVLLVWRPEVVVRNGAVINLNRRLVVFGDEDGFFIPDNLANPNVVVVVGVLDGLSGRPRFGFRVIGLLRDFRQTISIVPFVQLAVGGISVTLNIGKSSTYLPRIHTERNPAGGTRKTDCFGMQNTHGVDIKGQILLTTEGVMI